MNQALLIIGEPATGKSHLAHMLAGYFKSPHIISGNDVNFDNGLDINLDRPIKTLSRPDVIIIDDIRPSDLKYTYRWINDGVLIKPLFDDDFRAHPRIIITGDTCLKKEFQGEWNGRSFFEHFHIIELDTPPAAAVHYHHTKKLKG